MLCGRVFVWSPLSGASPRPDKKRQTNIRGAILYIQVSSIFNGIITLTGSTKYSQRLQTYCEPNCHTDIIRRIYLCFSFFFIRWPIPLAAMDQALIMSSIVLPMVHEFVQPLVLPAVPAEPEPFPPRSFSSARRVSSFFRTVLHGHVGKGERHIVRRCTS